MRRFPDAFIGHFIHVPLFLRKQLGLILLQLLIGDANGALLPFLLRILHRSQVAIGCGPDEILRNHETPLFQIDLVQRVDFARRLLSQGQNLVVPRGDDVSEFVFSGFREHLPDLVGFVHSFESVLEILHEIVGIDPVDQVAVPLVARMRELVEDFLDFVLVLGLLFVSQNRLKLKFAVNTSFKKKIIIT